MHPLRVFFLDPCCEKGGSYVHFFVNFGRGMLAIRDGTNETYSPPSHFLKDFKPWRKARRIMQFAINSHVANVCVLNDVCVFTIGAQPGTLKGQLFGCLRVLFPGRLYQDSLPTATKQPDTRLVQVEEQRWMLEAKLKGASNFGCPCRVLLYTDMNLASISKQTKCADALFRN